jgi:GT2 family glycosyltransferase/serine acetyltransferase
MSDRPFDHALVASVVIPTFNRLALLTRLLQQLGRQTVPADRFEVIVVDDGSLVKAKDSVPRLGLPPGVRFEEQLNQGAAAARHHGARLARGNVLIFIDDDMQVSPDFIAQHLACHEATSLPLVVLGEIRPDPAIGSLPLFERYEARMLDLFAATVRDGSTVPTGRHLYTGNVSMRRNDYAATGGFDASFKQSEDVELGIRLEKAGAGFHFAEQAFVLHGSDHTRLSSWLERAFRYGIYDLRLARKHPDVSNVNPFRFLGEVSPLSLPLLLSAIVLPSGAQLLSSAAIRTALAIDRLGLPSLAVKGTTLAFGIEYFAGIRNEEGGVIPTLRDGLRHFRRRTTGAEPSRRLLAAFRDAVRADHDTVRRYEAKYHQRSVGTGQLPRDLVEKIGFQMMAAYRVMRALRSRNALTRAKVVSRLMFVPGMGIAISHAATVGCGSILNHHVTLGEGTDPATGKTGAPSVGRNVHIGPGATLIGPITIGDGTKIAPGVLLLQSVPANSLVSAPVAQFQARRVEASRVPSNGSLAAQTSSAP